MKDFNDLLQAGMESAIISGFFNAEPYSPEGIISGERLWDELQQYKVSRNEKTYDYPWKDLTEMTGGLRKRELVMLTAGTGVAKTTFAMEIQRHLMRGGERVAGLYLESSPALTTLDILSPLVGTNLRRDPTHREDLQEQYFKEISPYLFLMENNWNGEFQAIERDIRYFASLGCSFIILDHISRLVSGAGGGDERKALDYISHHLKAMTEELDIGIIAVSHLSRPSGVGHEEGGQTHLGQLRGSAGIAQLSDIVIGLERNGQDSDERVRNTTTFRVLKNRWLGTTGVAGAVYYDSETTRLEEAIAEESDSLTMQRGF